MEVGTNWKRGRGGGRITPPLVLNFQGSVGRSPVFIVQYLDLSLSLECLTKGGSKMDPPFGSFKNERNEADPLNES